MERQLDSRLEHIKTLILTMGGNVEKALEKSVASLIARNSKGFAEVHEIERHINSDHIRVDNECVQFLAMQGPVARDLRMVVAIIKINSDLERMGDQCVNISYTGKDYLARTPISESLADIEQMSFLARKMVKGALDCFVQENAESAQKILLMDDDIDQLKGKVFKDLLALIKKQPELAEGALDLILIARNLERLGDHATNIAEDVIYASTGKDVRHGGGIN